MSGWAGFSDEELRRMQLNDSSVPVVSGRGRKHVSLNRTRQQIQRERVLMKSTSESSPLPSDQQLSSPAPKPQPKPEPKPGPKQTNKEPRPEPNEDQAKTEKPQEPERKEEETLVLKELGKQEVEIRERSRLEQLQHEQKLMEEKNKKKKALLTRTIAEKSKQTRAETLKLQRIQKELQTLDDMVSNDISILRGKIEQASWDYNSARKRYEKAEAEFVMAKLELHKKTELKEQLTEHLCAIIQQNELRKARKLEELMEQLELQTDERETDEEKREGNGEKREGNEEKRLGNKEKLEGNGEQGVRKQENHEKQVQPNKNDHTFKPETLQSKQKDSGVECLGSSAPS